MSGARCWCGGVIYNGHHCENGHIQYRVSLAVAAGLLALSGLVHASDFQTEPATVERVSDGAFEFRCAHGLHRAKTSEPVKVGQTITVRWRRVVEHDGKLVILTHAPSKEKNL